MAAWRRRDVLVSRLVFEVIWLAFSDARRVMLARVLERLVTLCWRLQARTRGVVEANDVVMELKGGTCGK